MISENELTQRAKAARNSKTIGTGTVIIVFGKGFTVNIMLDSDTLCVCSIPSPASSASLAWFGPAALKYRTRQGGGMFAGSER